ncbi:hypothetical protein Tcan_01673, partial [Toxocara canis]
YRRLFPIDDSCDKKPLATASSQTRCTKRTKTDADSHLCSRTWQLKLPFAVTKVCRAGLALFTLFLREFHKSQILTRFHFPTSDYDGERIPMHTRDSLRAFFCRRQPLKRTHHNSVILPRFTTTPVNRPVDYVAMRTSRALA